MLRGRHPTATTREPSLRLEEAILVKTSQYPALEAAVLAFDRDKNGGASFNLVGDDMIMTPVGVDRYRTENPCDPSPSLSSGNSTAEEFVEH